MKNWPVLPPYSTRDKCRFYAKVIGGTHLRGGCWMWGAAISSPSKVHRAIRQAQGQNAYDYGAFKLAGRTERAHRASFMMFKGPIPEDTVVSHSCDEPLCVNPAHLRAVSRSENNQEAHDRGRWHKLKVSVVCPPF